MDTKKIIEGIKEAIRPTENKTSSEEISEHIAPKQEADAETERKEVTIYALSTCPWCKKAKKFFTEKGIDFEYIEYDKADEETRKYIQEECKAYTEALGFPIVKIGDDAVVGYNTKKYSSLLDKR